MCIIGVNQSEKKHTASFFVFVPCGDCAALKLCNRITTLYFTLIKKLILLTFQVYIFFKSCINDWLID